MYQDITQFIKHCDACQKNKKQRQKRFRLLQGMPATDRRVQTPQKIFSDRHKSFTFPRFKGFVHKHNVQQRFTSAHHARANGNVERVNKTIVNRLKYKVYSTSSKILWTKLLEQVIQ